MADVVIDSARRAPSAEPALLRRQTSRPAAKALPIPSVGVVGTGEMSAAIAELLVDSGFPVTLHAASSELLDEGLARLDAKLDARVRNGELTRAERDRRTRLVSPTCWYIAMSSVDIVIVCEEESEDAIPAVFEALDRVMKRSAILATTATPSSLGKLANATPRRGDVIGIRFGEIVRDVRTSDDVLATLMSLANVLERTPS